MLIASEVESLEQSALLGIHRAEHVDRVTPPIEPVLEKVPASSRCRANAVSGSRISCRRPQHNFTISKFCVG